MVSMFHQDETEISKSSILSIVLIKNASIFYTNHSTTSLLNNSLKTLHGWRERNRRLLIPSGGSVLLAISF